MLKTVELVRRERFSSAHRLYLNHLSEEENNKLFNKCVNVHGHNYEIFVTLRGEIDMKEGLFINLKDFKKILLETVVDKLDHRYLNDLDEFKDIPPSIENMAIVFWGWIQEKLPEGLLYEIRLIETENNSVIYRGE